jgi:hypothetical protein
MTKNREPIPPTFGKMEKSITQKCPERPLPIRDQLGN